MSEQVHDRSRAAAQCASALARPAALASRCASLGVAFVMAFAVALPAHAGPEDGPPRRDNQQQSSRDNRWGDARDARSFEARAEEQRRMMQENANNAEMSRRMSRMTPDERRDLRRQINDARIEVYSNTPRR